MLKTLDIANIGLKGINTDIAPWELPAEFITEGVNFRVVSNKLESTGSFDVWSTPPVNFFPGFLQRVSVAGGDFWLVVGRNAVYAWNGTTWADVSSVVGYPLGVDGELLWTGALIGNIPIINNPGHYPEYWSPQSLSQIMQPLDFSPGVDWNTANKSFKVIRSHKNFLFALNIVENGVSIVHGYRWSHPAENNGLPFTWDETDISSLASIEQLGGDGGAIIDGFSLRNSFCIYSERAINLLDLSNDEFVFNRREMSSTIGLLNKNSIVEIKGRHIFLADGDIVSNDGNKITSIVHNRIRKRMNSQINADYFNRSFAVRNTAIKEVWFCVPEGSAQYPNVAYVYNWLDDSWAIKDLPATLTHASYGSQVKASVTYDTVAGTYNSTSLTYGSAVRTPLNDTVVGARSSDGALLLLDPGDNSSVDLNSRVERTNFMIEGNVGVVTISRIYPRMSGTSIVDIQIGAQDRAGAPVRWSPIKKFNPSTDRKLDVRITGELFCWRITSIGTGGWSISGMDLEYSPAGKR